MAYGHKERRSGHAMLGARQDGGADCRSLNAHGHLVRIGGHANPHSRATNQTVTSMAAVPTTMNAA
jgi:hypothetical protein